MYGYYDLNYLLIFIPFAALSWYVQYMLKSKFKKFSKQTLSANLSGKEIAEKMLSDHGIYDVKVISVKGQLSDHYNPQKKTVNLSQSVYNCLLYTSPSPRDRTRSRMPSSA